MERFTYYRKPINKYYLKGTNSAMVCFNGSNPCKKLGKLEDLEEEIGMPLLDLHNLIGKTIYYSIVPHMMDYEINYLKSLIYEDNEISQCEVMYITNHSLVYADYDIDEFELKYFGIYWFLTREEAEKKLEELKNERT